MLKSNTLTNGRPKSKKGASTQEIWNIMTGQAQGFPGKVTHLLQNLNTVTFTSLRDQHGQSASRGYAKLVKITVGGQQQLFFFKGYTQAKLHEYQNEIVCQYLARYLLIKTPAAIPLIIPQQIIDIRNQANQDPDNTKHIPNDVVAAIIFEGIVGSTSWERYTANHDIDQNFGDFEEIGKMCAFDCMIYNTDRFGAVELYEKSNMNNILLDNTLQAFAIDNNSFAVPLNNDGRDDGRYTVDDTNLGLFTGKLEEKFTKKKVQDEVYYNIVFKIVANINSGINTGHKIKVNPTILRQINDGVLYTLKNMRALSKKWKDIPTFIKERIGNDEYIDVLCGVIHNLKKQIMEVAPDAKTKHSAEFKMPIPKTK